MRRLFSRALLLIAMTAAASACDNNNNTSTPTSPTIPTVLTETFSGTLLKNAAYTHPFAVTDSGDVSVFLVQSVDPGQPDNVIPIGVSLGTWNGVSCSVVIASDNISPGASLTGRATAAGNLCVRVYDVGFVPRAANYELLIDHY
jgi:hypothetical protein